MPDAPLIELRNDHLTVSLRRRGAALVGLRLHDSAQNLVLGLAAPEDHDHIPIYAGALVGPIANRLERGCITVAGIRHQMALNENGQNTLHSGPEGLHSRDWQIKARSETSVTQICALADGACGLPGNRVISATYTLQDSTLSLEITATTDAATPMNIAAHPYWNLDGRGDVASHTVALHADRYLPTGPDNLPTGQIAQTTDTPFDFTTARHIPHDPALDVNYCLPADGAVHLVATLTGANGTRLRLSTDAPGLQVYNGAHLPDMPKALDGGGDLRPFGAIALEPQHWPNAPHNPSFPPIILHPGETYRQTTRYHLDRV